MAKKSKYWEGWGFTDLIKVILTGKPKERNEAYNEVTKTFDEAQVEKVGTDKIEIYLPEHEIKNLKAMAKLFGLKVQYATGGALPTESFKTGGRPPMSVAEIILQQIGGYGRVVAMTGAYNFVAGSNYLAFKIKNRRANYIKITLNGKDLYDIEIGRIFGSKYNVVKSYNDVYFDQLIPLLEEGTGMYFRFAKGGAVKKKELTEGALLAPNGKPSNLTPEQYKLVRTPAFKAWFGDWEKHPETSSKVVDSNGEPLVVYHFTDAEFTIFEINSSSEGFFFTENPKDNEFSTEGILEALEAKKYPKWLKEYIEVTGYSKEEVKEKLFKESRYKKGKPFFLNIRKMYDSAEIGKVPAQQWSIPMFENKHIRMGKIYGFNGVEFVRKTDNKRIIVAFEPEQIKLADGSNTTFDPENLDIRFAKGGKTEAILAPNGKPSNLTPEQYKLVRTPAFKAWFGDWEKDPQNASQVVDENGEPLVVYRGDSSASKKGNIFKTGFNRMGFINRDRLPNRFFHYFVDQYNVAKGYAENQVEDHNTEVEYSGKGKKWEAKVTPYFLNIRNAIDVTPNNPLFPTFKQYKESVKPTGGYSDPWDTSWYVPFWYGFDISKQYLHKILAEKIGDDYYYDDYYSKESNERRKERILDDTYWGHTFGHFIEYKTQRQYSDWLWFVYQGILKNKVDGLIFLEQTHWYLEKSKADEKKYQKGLLKLDPEVWRKKPKVFAALHSNQIKLADGSNTTFDSENPDIRFKKGGLIAPNGKPSNLTPEQYKLVRTPAFKAWFGDWEKDPQNASQVVDENGEPMQMFHNTNNKFTIFDKEKLGDSSGWETAYLGFYFGNKYEKGSYGKKTMKCFLNIRNPFLIKTEYYADFDREYKRKSEPLLMDDFFNKNKYDGILIDVDKLAEGETMDKVFVAFEPNQIKLSDGSNTTFDGSNPDIRFEEGGYLEQIANDPALEYAKGGRLLGYSFVTAYTDEGKKLYKLWKGQPTHQEVYRFFNKLNNSKGEKINIVDTEIEKKAFSKFNREAFLKMANKVAMEQYGSGISDIDELIFTFDTESLNVFPFEAELENDLDVQISCVDGIVFITEIDD